MVSVQVKWGKEKYPLEVDLSEDPLTFKVNFKLQHSLSQPNPVSSCSLADKITTGVVSLVRIL